MADEPRRPESIPSPPEGAVEYVAVEARVDAVVDALPVEAEEALPILAGMGDMSLEDSPEVSSPEDVSPPNNQIPEGDQVSEQQREVARLKGLMGRNPIVAVQYIQTLITNGQDSELVAAVRSEFGGLENMPNRVDQFLSELQEKYPDRSVDWSQVRSAKNANDLRSIPGFPSNEVNAMADRIYGDLADEVIMDSGGLTWEEYISENGINEFEAGLLREQFDRNVNELVAFVNNDVLNNASRTLEDIEAALALLEGVQENRALEGTSIADEDLKRQLEDLRASTSVNADDPVDQRQSGPVTPAVTPPGGGPRSGRDPSAPSSDESTPQSEESPNARAEQRNEGNQPREEEAAAAAEEASEWWGNATPEERLDRYREFLGDDPISPDNTVSVFNAIISNPNITTLEQFEEEFANLAANLALDEGVMATMRSSFADIWESREQSLTEEDIEVDPVDAQFEAGVKAALDYVEAIKIDLGMREVNRFATAWRRENFIKDLKTFGSGALIVAAIGLIFINPALGLSALAVMGGVRIRSEARKWWLGGDPAEEERLRREIGHTEALQQKVVSLWEQYKEKLTPEQAQSIIAMLQGFSTRSNVAPSISSAVGGAAAAAS